MSATDHVVIGRDASVLDQIRAPETMGVIWRGAFTAPALSFIGDVVRQRHNGSPGQSSVWLRNILPNYLVESSAKEFTENLQLLSRLFMALGRKVVGIGRLADLSRVEPADASVFSRISGPWHADRVGPLVALAVPAGLTSDYLPNPVPGQFDDLCYFHPTNHEVAEATALRLEQADFAVLKAADFPHSDNQKYRGLVHRRPNARLEADFHARAVIQWKLRSSRSLSLS